MTGGRMTAAAVDRVRRRAGVDRRVDGWVDLESTPGRPPAPASTGFSLVPESDYPPPT